MQYLGVDDFEVEEEGRQPRTGLEFVQDCSVLEPSVRSDERRSADHDPALASNLFVQDFGSERRLFANEEVVVAVVVHVREVEDHRAESKAVGDERELDSVRSFVWARSEYQMAAP